MKFSDPQTEAAYEIAVGGLVVQEVGVRSDEDQGPMWQALVRLNRANLNLINCEAPLYQAVKPGHDTLVWLVEDEPGHIITHRGEDCDAKGYADRMAALTAAFEAVSAHYTESTAEDFDFEEATR